MNAYLTHRNIAFGLAVVIGLGAFAGSARELWRIAETANYGLPVGLVAALDGLAVVCVIVLARHRDWQAVVTLAAATLLSIGLQILAVPREHVVEGVTVAVAADRYVSAVLVHALVPLASFMAVHLATRLDRPGTRPATVTSKPKPAPRPTPAPARPAPASTQPAPEALAERPARPVVRGKALGEVVAEARALAERKGIAPASLSQRTLRAELGIGDARAREVSRALQAGQATAAELKDPQGAVAALSGLHEVVLAADAPSTNGAKP